ncbi:histidine phosphatase family protein [Polaromonas sp.]|uniref:histidine phosphatase family protein n=1 Tax=Polaromonas sp. TaxID=1869339 RepID=UPI00272FC688|nr:histidine phosphatase family protein [Polaromonas sp.]MDP1740959.1 histidine phosphatase family protein [Polaromonas sp.]
MKTLYLVRHAASHTNVGLHWNDGPATIPLTAEGHARAREFARAWSVRPDILVVSSYVRSVQTALPLAEKFTLPLMTHRVQEFTYWDLKYSQPLPSEADRRSQVEEFWARLDPLEKEGGSNAESFVDFIERCMAFRLWVEQTDFESCIVFTHGYFMHAYRALMNDMVLPPKEMLSHLHTTLAGTAYANLEVAKYQIGAAK